MDLTFVEELKDKLVLARVGKPALIGIAVLIALVAVVGGRLMLTSTATASDFEVISSGASEESAPDGPSGSSEPEPAVKFVHVSGAVANPGLVQVGAAARLADAIDAAGGFTEDAFPESVNLARVVEDGEQVKVLTREESERPVQQPEAQAAAAGEAGPAADAGAEQGKVNINTATASQLTSLPGVGDATAQKIVSDREAQGPFKSIEDIKRVSGIGDKKYEAMADLICI